MRKSPNFHKPPHGIRTTNLILTAFAADVTELDLGSRAFLNDRSLDLLLDLISCKDLSVLKFSDSVFNLNTLTKIKKLIRNESNELNLRDCTTLGVEGCVLLKKLISKTNLKSLNLRNCNLTPPKMKNIFEGLISMKNKELKEFDLQGNCIGEVGLQMLKKVLQQKEIKHLDIGHCYISAKQLHYIVEGLSIMPGFMESINLGGNLVSRKDVNNFKLKTSCKLVKVDFY